MNRSCPRTRLPREGRGGGVGMQFSWEHPAALESFPPSLPPPRPLAAPVGPPPRCSPRSSPLAQGQPPSPAACGDGWRRRPKVKGGEPAVLGPLCARRAAPPPLAAPFLAAGPAPGLVTFPGVHFRTLKNPARAPLPETVVRRGGHPCRCGGPGSWGRRGNPLAARCPPQPRSAPQTPAVPRIQVRPDWQEPQSFLVHFVSVQGKQPSPEWVFFGVLSPIPIVRRGSLLF